jgi:hypothetical protein
MKRGQSRKRRPQRHRRHDSTEPSGRRTLPGQQCPRCGGRPARVSGRRERGATDAGRAQRETHVAVLGVKEDLFLEEINADGLLVGRVERAIAVALNQARLADSAGTNNNDLHCEVKVVHHRGIIVGKKKGKMWGNPDSLSAER